MGPRRRGWWTGPTLLAVGVAALASPVCREAPAPEGFSASSGDGRPPDGVRARVTEVIDGDTIAVEMPGGRAESVRYIGINTPESTPNQPLECFGHEAAAANAGLVGGRTVRLRFGPELRDDYGRLLAYVYARGALVNAELVEGGYARTLTFSPNDARAPLFTHLEARAGRAARGLWGSCASSFANLSGP
jgi:micrococcal nuclease